jgi:hypothetical protein
MISVAALLFAPLTLASSVQYLSTRQSTCSDAHIFLAKGNNEPYPGRQGALVNAICSGLESCDYEDILYYNPADADFCASVGQGVANGITQIKAYNARCPDTKLVISGYSQGAQIVGDILGGGGGTFFQGCQEATNAALDVNSAAGKKITAALVFGNIRHTAGQSYNVLTGGNGQGVYPRSGAQLAGLAQYSSVFHDYCVSTDPVCAGGGDVQTHLNYFDVYTNEAAAWVQRMLLATPETTPSSSVASPAATTAASSTSTFAPPYPTVAAGNGTASSATTITCVPAIPTATVSVVVTVTSCPVETSALATLPIATPHSATQSYIATQSAQSSYTAKSTPSASANSTTPVTFTGDASSARTGWGYFSIVAAGIMASFL